jgi:putative transposase
MKVTLMTEMMSRVDDTEDPDITAGLDGLDDQLINQLVDRAKAGGLQLTGEGGVLAQLTKRLLESALEGEITDHLGYDKHDPASRDGGNSRNGTRAKTVLTDDGPVQITVPRDRNGSFEPKTTCSRHRARTWSPPAGVRPGAAVPAHVVQGVGRSPDLARPDRGRVESFGRR